MTTKSPKVTTIGTFDGIHIGHQKILKRVVKLAKKQDFEPVVLTLFPHPRMVLHKDDSIKLLNTIDERVELLKSLGIKEVIVKEFTKEFANLSAKDYVKQILIDELNTKQIVIGYDHHFGKNRSANIEDLKEFAQLYDFKVEEISAQDIEDVTVSSTKIRNALNKGEVALANSFLGYSFFITGTVVKGKGLGRTINFPTANIYIKETYKLIPNDGVYVVKSKIAGQTVFGMMNIGTNPTVDGKTHSIEVHFFDFNADMYNTELKVEFLKRLRSEQKFESIEALKKQLKKDREAAFEFIK
ncbi:bifunctional riboflavin kinase/FAD synthetase [Winogradskyella echinorum]|uniref:Riboflavin biosynthesis protein n=1 Tax=Winogradskyella echinorum TaxID=538189 RepID=A0ABR6Y164_9FLAO|nr:bifunctional riboflavin kinase/FAD synthetase [Winogradskyella echinorum]MBC3846003.1 bifunctional riboflavin kinase/FAD synthetase [Winogradskyella echinorum]MBC5750351.1 bifunctional riboflavin kinase/FAD synthetase [Winogradskyella echinorum]